MTAGLTGGAGSRAGQGASSRKSIRELLQDRISGTNGRLPSERQLSDSFATTRITLRDALIQLEAEGVIYREDRRGWFVSPPRLVYNPLLRGYFDRMVREQGRVPRTHLLETGLATASTPVAAALGLAASDQALRVRRARFIDDRCILYAEHFLRPDVFPDILAEDLTTSMTEIYRRKYGVAIGRVTFEIMPTALAENAAAALHVAKGSPALLITRINRDQHGRVVDCDVEYWRHDAILVRVDAPDEASDDTCKP